MPAFGTELCSCRSKSLGCEACVINGHKLCDRGEEFLGVGSVVDKGTRAWKPWSVRKPFLSGYVKCERS